MRIKLSNAKRFFDEILSKEKISLNKLSKKLSGSYSTIKKYRRGELTLPSTLFDELIKISPNKEYWNKNIEKLSNNWGNSKAGKISATKNNRCKRMKYARSFKKIKKVKIKLSKFFCEFYGALLGDGCITKFKDSEGCQRFIIFISGNKVLDSEYLKYIKKMIKKELGINSYYYERKNINACSLTIRNKDLCLKLNKYFNFPIGRKYNGLKIPNRLLKLRWNYKKFVLRGLFDTDGCIFAKKNEKYKYPYITISSKNIKFLNQVKNMLKEVGYPVYITNDNLFIKGIGNTKKWFRDIGSSNNRNFFKYKYFLKNSQLPARLMGL